MKKILALVMAMTMGMGLVACGSSTSADTAADTTTETTESTDAAADTTAADGDASYLIGICQLVQHPALDAATQGFKDALTEEFGDAVQFDEQNAQGDSNTCSTIINSFAVQEANLYLDTHPSDQAALAYFQEYNQLRCQALNDYAALYGPLTIETARGGRGKWEWVNRPWPWEGEDC